MKKLFPLLLALLVTVSASAQKREFRGAWIQCVNGQFVGMSPAQMRNALTRQIDAIWRAGGNAIIFQVRGECDALYRSDIEPWSRFMTGVQGQAPSPSWDPLQWMITECHRRGMELHAWINPYRAKTKTTSVLAPSHVARRHPNWVFSYDGQLILNPAMKETRDYICHVVDDIVSRYDIDGLHIDDYFYPYPAPGNVIPDEQLYRQNPQGCRTLADWRRNNVNLFIKQLSDSIHSRKPWVKFGISPFGIYRNQASDPRNGSATRGLQNYDDLYADVLLWVNNGWVDYCVPQLYWQIGHPTADYATLIRWWNKMAGNRPLYIGEDVERTVKYPDPNNPVSNQQPAKYRLHRQMKNVNGTVLWYAKAVADNTGNYATILRDYYWRFPALQPQMPWIDKKKPKKPRKVKARWLPDGYMLTWERPKGKKWGDIVTRYVIYRFAEGEKINLDDPTHIIKITSATTYKLPYKDDTRKYTYVVTALDRMQNESKGVKEKVRL